MLASFHLVARALVGVWEHRRSAGFQGGGRNVELSGRGGVVVGGGSGIGRGIALGLAAEGMRVLVADIDADSAARVRDEIEARGGRAAAEKVDATDPSSLEVLAAASTAHVGAVHVLANTVGVVADTPLTEASEAEWAWFTEFHLMSAVRTVNAFLPAMRAHGGSGHIVLTSSMAGLLALSPAMTGGVNTGLYTVMKHALVGYGEMLRHELEPVGIGVSVLCPGLVESNLAATSARHRPARYGGPMIDPTAGRGMPPGAMPNEAVGPLVVRGIKANRAYILTHPETRPLVEARQRALLDDYAFFSAGE
jgi:NAD(P)-dependent dehydrogenase (short-subunit alcohol dehydrogenase family)